AAVIKILLSINARLTPTAMASILVAKAVIANTQNEWRATGVRSSASGRVLFLIMAMPSTTSRPKAIQWSQARTKSAAIDPAAQPASGVSASMVPKIKPVRKASENKGRCNVIPLPSAAAKASVDMAKASKAVDMTVTAGKAPRFLVQI